MTTKLTTFEARHGREANTVLRDLTKKLEKVRKQKCLRLDKKDSELKTIAYPQHSNWEETSNLVYAPTLRKSPLILDSDQQIDIDQEDEPLDKLSY